MAESPDSMDMSWEYTGPAVTFPVRSKAQSLSTTKASSRTSSLVSFPPLPQPKRTFSDFLNDTFINIGKVSVRFLAGAAVEVAKSAKRRLISRNDGTRAPRSPPRRTSPRRRFSPHFRDIPSRSSPTLRQDLSGMPGRRHTASITPIKFLNKSRPLLMPGTYPITPPRSPVAVTPNHATGFFVNNQSQASEAPATPQPLLDHDTVDTPSRAVPVVVVPEDGAAIVANDQHQASEATTTSQAQIEDTTESTPKDAVYLWLNYTAPPSPMFIIPSEDPATPASESDDWDKLTSMALRDLSPTTSTHFRKAIASASDGLIESRRPSPLTIGSIASASDESIESRRSSPLTTESIASASDESIESRRSSPLTTGSIDPAFNDTIVEKQSSPSTTGSIASGSGESIESRRSSPLTTGSIASGSGESIESRRSSPLTTGSIASGSGESIESRRSSSLTTGSIDPAFNDTIVEKQSSPSTTGSIETASNKMVKSDRSPPTTEVLERMSDELIESKRSSSTTGIIGAMFDGLIESDRSPSPSTVTPGPMSDEWNGSDGSNRSSSPVIETPGPVSDDLIAPNQPSTSILKRRVPLTQSANAANLGTQPPATPKPSVKFLEDPVSRYKKFAIGEPIDFPTPTSTVDSAASSPFEELPWPPSPETLRSLGYASQLETPTKASSHTSAHLPTESPSPPSTLEFTGFENLRIGGRRSAEEQLREEIAAYEKAKEESEAAARAKAASIARVRAAEVKDRKKKGWPSERVMQPLTVEWETRVHDALAKSASQTVATTCSGQKITRRDIGKLLPQPNSQDDSRGWLNDEIVDGYMEHIIDYGHRIRGQKRGETPKLHAFNSFFYNNLRDKGADSVKRWAKRAKIGGKDLLKVEHIFIPVNSYDAHWTLLVVSPKTKRIAYYDSMHGSSATHVKNIRQWIGSELGSEYNDREWRVVENYQSRGRGLGPTQRNNSDCGVFTVTTAKMIMLEVDPMAISAEDIPLQRQRMVAEMLNGGFSGDFVPHVVFD